RTSFPVRILDPLVDLSGGRLVSSDPLLASGHRRPTLSRTTGPRAGAAAEGASHLDAALSRYPVTSPATGASSTARRVNALSADRSRPARMIAGAAPLARRGPQPATRRAPTAGRGSIAV